MAQNQLSTSADSALLNRGSENILTPLKTVDKNNERNKKCREAYQKRSVETQNKSIPAGLRLSRPMFALLFSVGMKVIPITTFILLERETFTEDHPYSNSPSVNLVKPNFTNAYTDVPPGTGLLSFVLFYHMFKMYDVQVLTWFPLFCTKFFGYKLCVSKSTGLFLLANHCFDA
jgi:hypothetical protein